MNFHTLRILGIARALLAAALLALAGAPVAATLHELSHLRENAAAGAPKPGQIKRNCEVCAAFSAIGHALASKPHIHVAPQFTVAPYLPPALGTSPERIFAYSERAPPAPLNCD
ncbi:MAG: hypothetical protein M0015_07340 [Betaproteobacteria bacterium]|nr:hypothetical protein [Betaproteobacteria bacterium]